MRFVLQSPQPKIAQSILPERRGHGIQVSRVDQASQARSVSWQRMSWQRMSWQCMSWQVLMVLAGIVLFGGSLSSRVEAQGEYLLRTGDVVASTGQQDLLIPLYLTAPQPIQTLQVALEYDEVYTSVSGISLEGTPSVDAILTEQSGGSGVHLFALEFPSKPLAAFSERLLCYLRVNVLDVAPPNGLLVVVEIGDGDADATNSSGLGSLQKVSLIPGSISIYAGESMIVGSAETNNYQLFPPGPSGAPTPSHSAPIEIPLTVAVPSGAGAGSVFQTALEYDEVYTIQPGSEPGGSGFTAGAGFDTAVVVAGSTTAVGRSSVVISVECTADLLPGVYRLGVVTLTTEGFVPAGVSAVSSSGSNIDNGAPFAVEVAGEIVVLDYFIRGDAQVDGSIQITDVLSILAFSFDSEPLDCLDAADANDDGIIGLADVLLVSSYLFTGGAPPPPPFGVAGLDPTPESPPLGCWAP